ncbi:MAG: STAS domain-containing protein [Candidatus Sumerlaeia bacterium]|nr:STAS domain-containing protein [Candidatus Sumerlaeia bacterium]
MPLLIAGEPRLIDESAVIALRAVEGGDSLAQPREVVKRALAERPVIHLDLGAVGHIDSLQLSQLMMCHTTVANAGGRLILTHVHDAVRAVLTSMNLHRILVIE